ncbi:hypothetical protein [Bradyrhizobium sp. 6(2017)]|uniref:hypothetical protein n=1 Tax=Bradyrhizobium sp. 6(2017) TaxID=1197460 RepID=UPI0013E0EF67|nr:hypothetical protein [Bradyrhizobium sp. 6(2017)]QIG92190.1 hypothetical protein G6P99_06530 [Bradyrhizobium sp. 6(2017)]
MKQGAAGTRHFEPGGVFSRDARIVGDPNGVAARHGRSLPFALCSFQLPRADLLAHSSGSSLTPHHRHEQEIVVSIVDEPLGNERS